MMNMHELQMLKENIEFSECQKTQQFILLDVQFELHLGAILGNLAKTD